MAMVMALRCNACGTHLSVYVPKVVLFDCLGIPGNRQDFVDCDKEEEASGEIDLAKSMAEGVHGTFLDSRKATNCPTCGSAFDIKQILRQVGKSKGGDR